jgi:predicted HicB family RNase H-like nuclease
VLHGGKYDVKIFLVSSLTLDGSRAIKCYLVQRRSGQMARKPTDTVAITLRIREDLRRRLERAAEKYDVSLNAEMEKRLEASFDLANTASLIRVLTGGGFVADLLGAIAKVFDLGGNWKSYPDRTIAARVRIEAAYIALIVIFTELFSTPEHQLDPTSLAIPKGGGEVTIPQMEGLLMANSVLRKVEYPSLLIPSEAAPSERGLLKLPKKKKEKTK